MRLNRVLALGASALMVLSACGGGATPAPSATTTTPSAPAASASTGGAASPSTAAVKPADIKIGSDDFYESASSPRCGPRFWRRPASRSSVI